jgi:Bacterial SH3 domain
MNAREWLAALLSTLALAPFVGVLALLIVADAKAGGTETKPIATTGETNLRKAPGTDSEILTLIPKGTTVEVGDCRNGWCRVSWKGQDGYAIARNLGTAPASRAPVAAWQGYDHGPWQKVGKVDSAGAHEERDADHGLILEIGTAGEWPLNGERPNFGGTIAAEVTPIEDWLELEFGLSTLATAGHTELSGDVLFKKPFRLSPTVEFMIGAGPSISQTLNGSERGTSVSAEFALDFMFWPTKNVGWYLEPTWSVNPRNGQQSAAVSIGMLIGFPKP